MKRIAAILLLVIFLPVGKVCAGLAEDGDAGFWIRTDAEKKLSPKWKIGLGEELRFRENAGLAYADTHAGVSWFACEYFSAGAEYLQARNTRTVKKKDVWYWEARPRIYAAPQIKLRGWKLENRNMLEFRIKEQIRDSLRYRNQVALTAPWKWTRFEFQPTAFDEFFFETHRHGLTENRMFFGLKAHFFGPFSGMIGYLRQSLKSSAGDWKDSNILVTTVKASF